MLQTMDQSPTPTPLHTRAGSPDHGVAMPHSHEKAKQTVEALNDLMSDEDTQPIAETLDVLMPKEEKLVPVSDIDGSANVSTTSKLCNLVMYFTFNLGLTIFNKAVMIQVCITFYIL